MRACFHLLVLSLLLPSGCAPDVARVSAPPQPDPPPAVTVAAGTVAVDLDPQSCGCSLSQVDMALVSLPGVSRLKWDFPTWRVTLYSVAPAEPLPSDEMIRTALADISVELKAIHRHD